MSTAYANLLIVARSSVAAMVVDRVQVNPLSRPGSAVAVPQLG
jgi:hypothetical protein